MSKRARPAPICPICGDLAKLSPGKFGTRAACCGLWSWNLKPLVGRETHAARIHAHEVFDRLWKSGRLSRSEAYRRLRKAMALSADDCHIALMSEAQARRVSEIVSSGALESAADG